MDSVRGPSTYAFDMTENSSNAQYKGWKNFTHVLLQMFAITHTKKAKELVKYDVTHCL